MSTNVVHIIVRLVDTTSLQTSETCSMFTVILLLQPVASCQGREQDRVFYFVKYRICG